MEEDAKNHVRYDTQDKNGLVVGEFLGVKLRDQCARARQKADEDFDVLDKKVFSVPAQYETRSIEEERKREREGGGDWV